MDGRFHVEDMMEVKGSGQVDILGKGSAMALRIPWPDDTKVHDSYVVVDVQAEDKAEETTSLATKQGRQGSRIPAQRWQVGETMSMPTKREQWRSGFLGGNDGRPEKQCRWRRRLGRRRPPV
ncbi:Os02g0290350 [Oryza sativa Japonica Group]|uniref:Os02g0290350 protein n=1 Tax=Oryza sativa subsp. japonica TaxID=39947 RepID=A0A0P0VHV5_ORYSJ|nr:Os02g0290350 [Oryza sativa Japonica Group]